MKTLLTTFALWVQLCLIHAQNSVEVTYIGNEGFLIKSSTKKVIIDALQPWESSVYTQERLLNNKEPFNNIDLCFTTHSDGDHFDAGMSSILLNNSSNTYFVGPQEVKDMLKSQPGYAEFSSRVISLAPNWNKFVDTTVNSIQFRALRLHHDVREIQNLGYLIELNGLKIFHDGDYSGDYTGNHTGHLFFEMDTFKLKNERIDIAFLNFYSFWDGLERLKEIKDAIHPKQIILMHMNPGTEKAIADSVKKLAGYPPILVFLNSTDKKIFYKQGDSLSVVNVNEAPVVQTSIPNTTAFVGRNFNYTIPAGSFTDPNINDRLEYSARLIKTESLPNWLQFNSSNQTFTGTPTSSDTFSIAVIASDTSYANIADTFNITVNYDYLGQTPPGDTAVMFAPGIISLPNRGEYSIAFSPDGKECYFDAYDSVSGGIFFTKYINNAWTEQKEAPFSIALNHTAQIPFFSADGKRLYFNSDYNIGYIERIDSGWSQPQFLPSPINSDSADYFYSETVDGVGYFSSSRSGGVNNSLDIWRVDRSPDSSFKVENLGPIVNSSTEDFSSCIAPDGSYLIFASYRSSAYSEQSLWISFNKGENNWTKPIDMEISKAKINIPRYWQIAPSISPDGKYLFFCHHAAARDSIHMFWVSTHILVGLKKYAFAPRLSSQIPNMNVKTDSAINYVIPENTFSCEYGTASLKYTASLKDGSALPKWLTFNPTTKTFSGTPVKQGSDTIKITVTNADKVSTTCTFRINISSKVDISQFAKPNIYIYPNPTTGLVNVSFGNTVKKAKVEIYNVQGTQVFSKTFKNTPSATIDLTGYAAGIYVVKIIVDGVSYEEKIVKE